MVINNRTCALYRTKKPQGGSYHASHRLYHNDRSDHVGSCLPVLS